MEVGKMGTKKIRSFDSKFKAKVALEAIKGEKTIAEIASMFDVLPRSVVGWKKEFLENMDLIFDKDKAVKVYKDQLKAREIEQDQLYKQIGKLTTQNEWMKKKSEEYGLGV